MQSNLRKISLKWTLVIFCLTMSVMLFYSATKTLFIAQEAPLDSENQMEVDNFSGWTEQKVSQLLFEKQDPEKEELTIPLSGQIKADDISIENFYNEHVLQITLDGKYSDFYKKNPLSGNYEHVKNGFCADEEKTTKLIFQLDMLLDYQYVLEDNQLKLTFQRPVDIYDKIVLLDPARTGKRENGVSENELTLKIVDLINERLKDSDIKIYTTRMDEREQSAEDVSQLIRELKADLLIHLQLETDAQGSTRGIQSSYNSGYVIPGFGNVELADLLEREVAQAVGAPANGLFVVEDEDSVLQMSEVPSAAISLGYLSNQTDAERLSTTQYQELLADAIVSAIEKSFEKLEDNKKITIESK